MNEQSEHLSNAQIESYGERTSGAAVDDQLTEEHWVEAHLEGCSFCRDRVLNFHRAHFGVLNDSAFPASGSAGLKAGNANPGSQVDSSRIPPATGNLQSAGRVRLDGTQAAQLDGQNYSGPRTAQPVNTVATPDCPSADELRRLAAGILEPALAEKLNRHVSSCSHCDPLLQAYTEDFSDDFSPEEQAILADLKSSSASWQQQTARKMLNAAFMIAKETDTANAQTARLNISKVDTAPAANVISGVSADRDGDDHSTVAATNAATIADKTIIADLSKGTANTSPAIRLKSTKSPLLGKWLPIPATAALTAAVCMIVALGGVGIWYARRDTPEKVEKLLAQAYTEQRTIEMRIPYAAHSDFKQTRSGGSTSILDLPASLRKSAELIDSQLKKNPDDPNWILLSAQLDILQWNYKPALNTLNKIEDANIIKSPQMRLTRALALYEQAELEPERKDQTYGEVINLLGEVLQSTPDDPVVLFNHAQACEKIYAYECAISDYEHLLKIDTGSGWAQEARDHLNRIKEKKTPEH